MSDKRTVNEIAALQLDDELARIQIKIIMQTGLAVIGFDVLAAADAIMDVRRQVRQYANKQDLSEI